MFLINTAKGFAVLRPRPDASKSQNYDFTPDAREATPFLSFDDADNTAKHCVQICLPRKQHYFSILDTNNTTAAVSCNINILDVEVREVPEMVEIHFTRRLTDRVKQLIS